MYFGRSRRFDVLNPAPISGPESEVKRSKGKMKESNSRLVWHTEVFQTYEMKCIISPFFFFFAESRAHQPGAKSMLQKGIIQWLTRPRIPNSIKRFAGIHHVIIGFYNPSGLF